MRPFLLLRSPLPLSSFLRLKPSWVSLFNVTLCATSSFSNPSFSLFIHHPFHALLLSFFLSLAISHQLTYTLRRRQAPVPCGLVLRARGCCEIIVSPHQPPRVTPRRGKQQWEPGRRHSRSPGNEGGETGESLSLPLSLLCLSSFLVLSVSVRRSRVSRVSRRRRFNPYSSLEFYQRGKSSRTRANRLPGEYRVARVTWTWTRVNLFRE